nr:acyltransferase family protein [Citrobacter sp. RHB25-C09]
MVVFFHAKLPVQGGFVGVDVFFVISGFLITCILDKEIRESRFSYTSFYLRRIKRLIPALFLCL